MQKAAPVRLMEHNYMPKMRLFGSVGIAKSINTQNIQNKQINLTKNEVNISA